MLTLKESLKHYKTTELRKALSTYNKSVKISGYSKLSRDDLENLILLNSSKFQHMILEKAPEEKKKVVKPMGKKEVKPMEKEEVKPMEEEEEDQNLVNLKLFMKDVSKPTANKEVLRTYTYLKYLQQKKVWNEVRLYFVKIQDNYKKWYTAKLDKSKQKIIELEDEIKTVEKIPESQRKRDQNIKSLNTELDNYKSAFEKNKKRFDIFKNMKFDTESDMRYFSEKADIYD